VHTCASSPCQYVFLDIIHPKVSTGLTPAISFPFYLILGDAHSRYTSIYGIPDKSLDNVVSTLKQCQADPLQARACGFSDISCICTTAGSQFTSDEFCQYCRDNNIHLVVAARPKKQYQNHLVQSSISRQCPLWHAHYLCMRACQRLSVIMLLNTPWNPHPYALTARVPHPWESHTKIPSTLVISRDNTIMLGKQSLQIALSCKG
jgi:hypothetical protein